MRTIAILVTVFTIGGWSAALAGTDPVVGDDDGARGLQWLYDSPLDVREEVIHLGGSLYRYRYSFTNVDTAPIWHLGVFTTFPTEGSIDTWQGYADWRADSAPLTDALDAYDGSDNWPELTHFVYTYADDWPDPAHPIAPGETVRNFSFTANVGDYQSKPYYYETVESGYAPYNGGFVASVGFTVPATVATGGATWSAVKRLFE